MTTIDDQTEDPTRERKRAPKTARNKLMDYLARRDHSELELRQKLAKDFSSSDIDSAIDYAREHKWLIEPQELSGKVAHQLGRKLKGLRFINQYLKGKGLPPVAKNLDDELVKALDVIEWKFGEKTSFTFEEKLKIRRLLANRGFDDETIRRATSGLKV